MARTVRCSSAASSVPVAPGADDGDMQLARADRPILTVGAQAGVDQPAIEPIGLVRRLERDGELGRARRSEIVGDAADRHHQRVVIERHRRGDLPSLVVHHRAEMKLLGVAVEPDDLAEPVGEMVPVCLGEVVQLVLGPAQATRGQRVQQRLPDMGPVALDERDLRQTFRAKLVAQLGDQLQPGGSAPGDDDMMHGRLQLST